jgi:hypothetical protein
MHLIVADAPPRPILEAAPPGSSGNRAERPATGETAGDPNVT